MAELVGGEPEDGEPLILVLFVNFLEAFILGGQAALAGGVDDQEDFAFISGEVDRLPFNVLDLEIEGGTGFLGLVGREGDARREDGRECEGRERQN